MTSVSGPDAAAATRGSERENAAMRRMVVDAATAEVVGALRERAVRPILIKGATIARWLYPPGSRRTYIDVDLLIRPADFDRAAEVLAALGYRQLLPEPAIGTPAADHPSWYAVHFTRAGARQADVDLHQTVFWATVDHDSVWELMSRGTEAITIGGIEVEAPGYAARALLLPLHAAQHGQVEGTPIDDLKLAVASLDDSLWREAAELAARIGASEPFAVGLRMVAGGATLAGRLALPRNASTRVRLVSEGNALVALGLEQLLEEPSAVGRAKLLLTKLVPSPDYIRLAYPPARPGRVGLLEAYLARTRRLLRHTPAAVTALRAARRASKGR